jgi:hypothetical protein
MRVRPDQGSRCQQGRLPAGNPARQQIPLVAPLDLLVERGGLVLFSVPHYRRVKQ